MRRLFRALVIGALLSLITALARKLLDPDKPVHDLNGHGAIVGSLDTWPPVPRAPAASN